ncbi:Protein ORF73 [Lasiodiplodia hormozganensis]|uniref:Protein ORF73 n=1 Tax=Lasiodiplodia hormozganensis TaxID=869390 RepID=A0AA40BVQ5_9PEZI|nr:Protein ORF73 [Lasiodiplodia hormozganensis]
MHADTQTPPFRRRGTNSSETPLSPDIEAPQLRTASLVGITTPSSATFRAQTPASPTVTSPPVRRKPLPANASPVATRFSSQSYTTGPRIIERGHTQRAFSTDTTPHPFARSQAVFTPPLTATKEEFHPNTQENSAPASDPLDDYIAEDRDRARRASSQYGDLLPVGNNSRPGYDRAASSYHTAQVSTSEWDPETVPNHAHGHERTPTMSSYDSQRTPNLTLQIHGEDGVTGDFLDYDQLTDDEDRSPKPEMATGNKFTSFFGWKSGSQNVANGSPTTNFSGDSPAPNPQKKTPKALDIPAANSQQSYFTVPGTPLYSSSHSVNAHVEELERELREISAELAGSIKRELELEDELESYKAENPTGTTENRRTSDYYSDSGASSAKFPIGDTEARLETLEKLRRKAEQDRAQAKNETAQRLQDELRRRADLEAQVQSLEEQLQGNEKLDDIKRRLADEKQAKENLEDLLAALRQAHDKDRGERDNLRDEIIPQLTARLSGLETGAGEVEKLRYENTRLQQELESFQMEILPDLRTRLEQFKDMQQENARLQYELDNVRNETNDAQADRIEKLQDEITRLKRQLSTVQNEANIAEVAQLQASQLQSLGEENSRLQQEVQTLRNENQSLINARRMRLELAQSSDRFNSISEEGEEGAPSASPKIGLSRSNSLARNSVQLLKRGSRSGTLSGLSRSNSVKEKGEAPRDFGEKMKDVEEQRDALHRALKQLLARYEQQQKDHAKKIKLLEMERDRALNVSPRRTAFHNEVTNLRAEINLLRKRADDALDQKWQVEKNLGGLRMDLARAELETSSLRDLMGEKDMFAQERRPSAGSVYSDDSQAPVTLERAYKELQTLHALSLARVKGMEEGEDAAEAERVLGLLKQSISDAKAERDNALKEAETYRQQARALQESEVAHLDKEHSLASELFGAAKRMDELAAQTQAQLQQNDALKQRLAEAIGRGESEQRLAAKRITEMQSKLRAAEESVSVAQSQSDEALNPHEDELRAINDSQVAQLKRMQNARGLLDPTKLTPAHSPLPKPLSPIFVQRSPRLDITSSGLGISIQQATKTEDLEHKVHNLEKALSDADREMEEVVSRMNMAQIEVAELQSEKDEAMRETRRLQAEITAQRELVKELMSQQSA